MTDDDELTPDESAKVLNALATGTWPKQKLFPKPILKVTT